MEEISGLFFAMLMNWVRAISNRVWEMIRGGGGSGASWFAAHWIELIVVILVAGLVIDWFMWMMRWRPYRLWFSNMRRMRKGGLIAAQTFAAAPVYVQEDDMAPDAASLVNAGDWSGDDEQDEPAISAEVLQQDAESVVQFAYLEPESAEMDEGLADSELSGGDAIDDIVIVADAIESEEELTGGDGEEDADILPDGEYQTEDYQVASADLPDDGASEWVGYASRHRPVIDADPLTDRWDELYGGDVGGAMESIPAGDDEESSDEEYANEEYPAMETDYEEEDYEDTFDDGYAPAGYEAAEENDYQYSQRGEPQARGGWGLFGGKRERSDVIRTVMGRPARRRGIFRLTGDENEAISGLPPMMPLEQGYNKPKLPPRRPDSISPGGR